MRWTTIETRERPALSSYTSLSGLRNLLKLSEPPLATMYMPGDMAEVDSASREAQAADVTHVRSKLRKTPTVRGLRRGERGASSPVSSERMMALAPGRRR